MAAALLAGCATTSADLRDREPLAVYQTSRPVPQIVRCLTDRIETGSPSVITDETVTTVSFYDRGAAVLVYSIAGGTVRVWRLHSLVPYERASQACLQG